MLSPSFFSFAPKPRAEAFSPSLSPRRGRQDTSKKRNSKDLQAVKPLVLFLFSGLRTTSVLGQLEGCQGLLGVDGGGGDLLAQIQGLFWFSYHLLRRPQPSWFVRGCPSSEGAAPGPECPGPEHRQGKASSCLHQRQERPSVSLPRQACSPDRTPRQSSTSREACTWVGNLPMDWHPRPVF